MREGIKKSFPLAAMWVSMWTKIIVPQAYRSNSTFVIVLQDRQKLDAQFGKKTKPTLGEALLFDTSIIIECTHSTPIKKGKDGDVIGNEHHFILEKNKVDGFTSQKGSFFTSTGKGDVPAGFDFVREAIEEGKARGVIKQNSDKTKIVVDLGQGKGSLWEIEGGWADFRELLLAKPVELKCLVDGLNAQARRMK